jgi:signal transduction histidine kinase
MPAPVLREVRLSPLIARVAGLETRVQVCVKPGPDVAFQADPDQLEQMFINLVRNAADAVLEAKGASPDDSGATESEPENISENIEVHWSADADDIVLAIDDHGPGLLNPANVFTPFYTTKPNGSGVGLVLSRQIAEAHGGRIEISNRRDVRGCTVRVVLPRSRANVTATAVNL